MIEKTDKPKKQNTMSGQADRDERDGKTGDRIAWPEKIALAMQPFGTEQGAKWFTHAAILKRLQDQGYTGAPARLSIILRGMVKDGYLERADKPEKMKAKYRTIPEYIYRRTGKAFTAKSLGAGMNGNPGKTMQKGFEIWQDHPRLPKWFRDMMQ